jgi:branched-subunit amino acid transport protein AzlD
VLTIPLAIVAVLACAAVTYALRAFPFLLFSAGTMPRALRVAGRFLPLLVTAALLVWSLKASHFSPPALASLAVTAVLHIWKRNSLLSIFSGTALYMVLLRVLG